MAAIPEIDPTRGTVKEKSRPRSQFARITAEGLLLDRAPLAGPQVAGFGRFDLDSSRGEGRSLLFYASNATTPAALRRDACALWVLAAIAKP